MPVVHSTVMIHLRDKKSHDLGYKPLDKEYTWQLTDISFFSYNALKADVNMYISNKEFYGYMMPPLMEVQTPEDRKEQFKNTRIVSLNGRCCNNRLMFKSI